MFSAKKYRLPPEGTQNSQLLFFGGKFFFEVLGGVALSVLDDLFGCAGGNDFSAGVAAFGTKVNDIIGHLDHVQIMLDHNDGIAQIGQSPQNIHQVMNIGKVQAGRWLIENIQRMAGARLAEFGGEFNALGLAAGQGRAGLAERHIPQADITEGFDQPDDLGEVGKKLLGLFDPHVENVGNVFALVGDLQGFRIVAFALAFLAGHKHIRQKMHLDLFSALPLAVLAAAAFDIKAEPAGFVAADLRFACDGKQRPDQVEDAGVRRRVASGRPSDGRLVDFDHFVDA